jgi:ribosomal protein S18 acetylase RimI-like enzyme
MSSRAATASAAPRLRRCRPADARAAAPLILEAVPSLEPVLGDRRLALRGLEACYLSERTEFAHRYGLFAEVDGSIGGVVIAFPGRHAQGFKLGTGVTLARAAGPRHAAEVVRRERILSRLLPGVDRRFLYVSTLAVAADHRRKGIGTMLMERVLAGAQHLGMDLALDTAMDEPPQLLYERFGFRVASRRETTPTERKLLPIRGMVRMELRGLSWEAPSPLA